MGGGMKVDWRDDKLGSAETRMHKRVQRGSPNAYDRNGTTKRLIKMAGDANGQPQKNTPRQFQDSPMGVKTAVQHNYNTLLETCHLRQCLQSGIKCIYILVRDEPLYRSTLTATSIFSWICYTASKHYTVEPLQTAQDHTSMTHVITVLHNQEVISSSLDDIIQCKLQYQPLYNKLLKDNGWTSTQINAIDW
jgi:hypothetical protein